MRFNYRIMNTSTRKRKAFEWWVKTDGLKTISEILKSVKESTKKQNLDILSIKNGKESFSYNLRLQKYEMK